MNALKATVDRDSVCAGDDCDPHNASFDTSTDATLAEFVQQAARACPLASIAGGRATWLVDTEGDGKGCIGVLAQQWTAPRFLLPESTTVAQHFGARPPSVYFRYWCQASPDAVFDALRSNSPLPSRYGN
jgi:hypothetical protein